MNGKERASPLAVAIDTAGEAAVISSSHRLAFSKESRLSYAIERAAVLGSGVMGSALAAHLANAGIPVLLLDIVPPAGSNVKNAR